MDDAEPKRLKAAECTRAAEVVRATLLWTSVPDAGAIVRPVSVSVAITNSTISV